MTEARHHQHGAGTPTGETGGAKSSGHCCHNGPSHVHHHHEDGAHGQAGTEHQMQHEHGSAGTTASLVKDPVCGMAVDPRSAKHKTEHRGNIYYFCSARCRERFEAEPTKYVAPAPAKTEPVPEGAIYTCPMHPEIRQAGPGHCPICGMALEPVLATAESGPDPELIDMRRRFWVGLVLSLPVLALEMGGHVTGLDALLGKQNSNWVQLVLATPVVLWAGWPFFERGWT